MTLLVKHRTDHEIAAKLQLSITSTILSTVTEWNKFNPSIQNSEDINVFKRSY